MAIKRRRDIAVIGASLGGIKALGEVLKGLRSYHQGTVFVVQHIAPDSPRLLESLLRKSTSLEVRYASNAEATRIGFVYIAPPDHHLVVESVNVIGLKKTAKVHHSRPAADVLFESAARIYGSRVVGVVLTGGGTDGTDGLVAIKAAGGLSVVQHPLDAVNPQMPMSALNGDSPDICIALAEIGPLLSELAEGTA